MIYTCGYQGKKKEYILELVKKYDIDILLDVRSTPYSRYNKDFDRENLKNLLGMKYRWMGNILGGYSKIEEKDLEGLKILAESKNILIMCMEKDYKKCHRHYEISRRLVEMGYSNIYHILDENKILSIMETEIIKQKNIFVEG